MEKEILTPEKVKSLIEEIGSIDAESERLKTRKKELEAIVKAYAKDEIDKAGVTEIRNPLFTITKTTTTKKDIVLQNVVQNLDALQVLFDYIKNGNRITISGAKTFENFYNKRENVQTPYESLCKVSENADYSIKLRPVEPVEGKMEI